MRVKIYFRALDELFCLVESRSSTAQCRVTVSYIEIYKEELRDLLDGGGMVGGVAQQPLVIREDEQGNTGGQRQHYFNYWCLGGACIS